MAPEYIEHGDVDVRGDVFALGVVLWESITNQRLFRADNDLETMRRVGSMAAPLISSVLPSLGTALDAVVAKSLEKSPARRYSTARAFAEALESVGRQADLVATATEVGDFVRAVAGAEIAKRRALVRERGGGEAALSTSGSFAPTPVAESGDATATATAPNAPTPTVTTSTSTNTAIAVKAATTPESETATAIPSSGVGGDRTTHRMASIDAAARSEGPAFAAEGELRTETSLSTLDRSGVSAPIVVTDESSREELRAARKQRARIGVILAVGSLGLATMGIAVSRFVFAPGRSGSREPASLSVGGPVTTALTSPVSTASTRATAAPSAPIEATPTAAAVTVTPKEPAPPIPATTADEAGPSRSEAASPRASSIAHPTVKPLNGRASSARVEPTKSPGGDKAPPNPYAHQ